MSPPRIGYWNIRGFAQPIRLLLAFTDTEFEDKRYNFIGSDYDRSEWFNEKFTHSLDFPNLPYLFDGDVKLSQTFAILKYLGRKHDLIAKNSAEQLRIDLIEAEAMDMRTKWAMLIYGKTDFTKSKPEYFENFAIKMKEFSTFLGNNPYFAGDHITWLDFLVYDLLDIHRLLEPTALTNFSNLEAYQSRIEALPTVAAYMKSDQFIEYPITAGKALNGQAAAWGGL